MVLRSGYLFLAQRLQEAADSMAHSEVQSHLADAVRDAHKGSGSYAHYIDHTGDGKTGDVMYHLNGDTMSAPYSIASGSSKQTATVDTSKAEKVIPHVTYKKHSTSTDATEAARIAAESGLKLLEATNWKEDALSLIEAAGTPAEMELKLIAPGKGSSAFYPAEVLKRDGPGVFAKNTQIYINHATAAEESQRPEGDWHKLAGALSSDAYWLESHAKGPGLYAKAKFSSDYAPLVKEKAPFSGMSIRANGTAAQESGRTQMKDGVPVLAKLISAESVDVVTKAGAGGMILTESARRAAAEGEEMTDEDRKLLREAIRVQTETRARSVATSALADVSLMEAGKSRVIDSCLRNLPMSNGVLDEARLIETVKDEAKREGEYLSSLLGGGRVLGMGTAHRTSELTEAEIDANERKEERRLKEVKRLEESQASIYGDILGDVRIGALAAKGRAA